MLRVEGEGKRLDVGCWMLDAGGGDMEDRQWCRRVSVEITYTFFSYRWEVTMCLDSIYVRDWGGVVEICGFVTTWCKDGRG